MSALCPDVGRTFCVLVLAVTCLAAPAAWAAPAPVDEQLSDERTFSHWAFSKRREPIRVSPSSSATQVAKLRLRTELYAPEVYLVLSRRTLSDEESWLQVRIPMRPNGRIGWVPEDALGPLHVTHTQLRISRTRRRATLYESGKRVWSAPVGIGRAGTVTPAGRFYVRERLHLGASGGPYGVFAFGTSAYSPNLSDWPGGGVIGIHGTDQPGLIPGRVSHGCVRVRNPDILRLKRLMGLGTPIEIR